MGASGLRVFDVNIGESAPDSVARLLSCGVAQRRITMTAAAPQFPVIREAVASFPDRVHFKSAVGALMRPVLK